MLPEPTDESVGLSSSDVTILHLTLKPQVPWHILPRTLDSGKMPARHAEIVLINLETSATYKRMYSVFGRREC